MKSRKVELLAPAGNYDSFIAAINAGADAVYVGGEKFSARAYADNFDTQTLCDCIKYAHLFGRRVYLTLNTLIKESEFSEIYDYVKPFYLAGLDGVIIQDLGVLRYLKNHFPHIELHASTQMAVTGKEFVSLCREFGISRVVPARELSLNELKTIRDAGIEVECFIHGAMCYCYSGMCLMSSILGGRSGNRGKCAQPCRLPYQVTDGGVRHDQKYTLSLKDMCTIEHIPNLIKAGMDSFKIEGRMKRSEYAAGVTALYRKYIDQYYEAPDKPLRISKEDRYILEHLYMRSELHDGYLFKHNGKEMITGDAPSYNGLDDSILMDIRQKYLGYTQKLPVSFYGYFEVGKGCSLTAVTESGLSVTINGPVVEEARKDPSNEDMVVKQLKKLGNTCFSLQDISVMLSGNVFLPNSVLNTLRRDVILLLEEEIIHSYFPDLKSRLSEEELIALRSEESLEKAVRAPNVLPGQGLSVLVRTKEQLSSLCSHSLLQDIKCVYLEEEVMEALCTGDVYLPQHILPIYAMPYIIRQKDTANMEAFLQRIVQKGVKHILVRNMEELALVYRLLGKEEMHIITDASLYCWNLEAKKLWSEYSERITLPFELNAKEMKSLRDPSTEQIIYGYIPLMVTANCIYKTNFTCKLSKDFSSQTAHLTDRYGKVFTAVTNCKHCYNIIYNSVPLALHKKYNKKWPGTCRIQFSIENANQTKAVLDYFEDWLNDRAGEFPISEYTTSHENRKVE